MNEPSRPTRNRDARQRDEYARRTDGRNICLENEWDELDGVRGVAPSGWAGASSRRCEGAE